VAYRYVADAESSSLRLLNLNTGGSRRIAGGDGVIAGNLFRCGDRDGAGARALLQHPLDLATAANGDVYIVDSFNHKIKRYSPKSDTIETVAGTGEAGARDGGAQAQFSEPGGLAVVGHRVSSSAPWVGDDVGQDRSIVLGSRHYESEDKSEAEADLDADAMLTEQEARELFDGFTFMTRHAFLRVIDAEASSAGSKSAGATVNVADTNNCAIRVIKVAPDGSEASVRTLHLTDVPPVRSRQPVGDVARTPGPGDAQCAESMHGLTGAVTVHVELPDGCTLHKEGCGWKARLVASAPHARSVDDISPAPWMLDQAYGFGGEKLMVEGQACRFHEMPAPQLPRVKVV
jgi:hypothetical protein